MQDARPPCLYFYATPPQTWCLNPRPPLSGISHGLDLVCGNLSKPGDVILVEQPTYFLGQSLYE